MLARLCCMMLAGAALAAGTGCFAPVAAGVAYGGYEYINGKMNYAVYARVDKTRRAVETVLKERGWEVKEHTEDATTAYYRCILQDKTQVEVDLERRSHDFTRVGVRYGVFGDENESKSFIEQVKSKL